MDRDIGDIIDRWSIARLKFERGSQDEEREKEFIAFQKSYDEIKKKYNNINIEDLAQMLYIINGYIWMFESGLKSGKQDLPEPHYIFDPRNEKSLAKLGIIAIETRYINSLRIMIKNYINKLTHTGFQDIKRRHLSE